MTRRWNRAMAPWLVVAVVGFAIVALVIGLRLFDRLGAGQDLLDDAAPAFTAERVAGDRAGITIVSQIVDLADPLVTERGGGAAEVPKLVAFVSEESGLSEAEVLSALQENFPQTTGLLQALPLSGVAAEVPKLEAFLAETLGLPPAQVRDALKSSFPRLSQSLAALPAVADGWYSVPGTESLTRFDGSPATTVPAVRDYFADDVIPVLERQQENFTTLESRYPGVDVFPPLLLIVALVVLILTALMLFMTLRPATAGDRALSGAKA